MHVSISEACRHYQWLPHAEYQKFVLNRSFGLVSSQISEDCFNYMKNSKVIKGKQKVSSRGKSMAVMCSAKVASTDTVTKNFVWTWHLTSSSSILIQVCLCQIWEKVIGFPTYGQHITNN